MKEFNPQLWFGNRELDTLPSHFVKAPTPLSTESLEWVKTKLTGRYTIVESNSSQLITIMIFDHHKCVYFEDPKEAMYYELRWSGTKNN